MGLSYLVLGVVAGLAAVERKGFLQAMLSRPIALAPMTGWALGDPQGGLLVAPPLELLWLGAVNLGAALPVHEALGTVAITGGAVLAGRALGVAVSPEVAILAVLLCAPLALVGRRADRHVEIWNDRLVERAEAALAGGDPGAAVRWNLGGLAAPFAVAALLAPAGAALAAAVIPAFLRAVPAASGPLRLGFFAFAALAAASGAKALRAREAPRFFYGALGGALVAGLLIGGALS
ncbi:PTS sugar transporter subunit IIC [Anaeromyxobacter terrae]|uniref:PTS sugar transporter subunit IIC n=1 Tax=Anaeromyxobacter terrae TaxID=2925406 RepID=UPI001F5A5259|nr:PTS sugar transporter subunit IIC [Anaeromyxobacter sp. SG22]